jgi:hypothetical protein
MSCFQARLLSLVAEFDSLGGYEQDGSASTADWLAQRLKLSRSTALSWAGLASRLSRLPALSQTFARGRISFDQLEPLAMAASFGDEEYLASVAPTWSVAQCRLYARRARPVSLEEAEAQHAERTLTMRRRRDGALRMSALFDPEGGSILEQALTDHASQAPPDPTTGEMDPLPKRLADSLVDLVSAGHQAREPGRATVVVHVTSSSAVRRGDAMSPGTGGAPEGAKDIDDRGIALGPAEAEGGYGLADAAARRMSCDCIWQAVAEGVEGELIAIAKARRSAPGWLRRQLHHRDVMCRFPGCERKRLLHAHHIVHWADGGQTELSNLVLLCSWHHRFVHERGWKISGDPSGELCFTSPEGSSLVSRPVPMPATVLVTRAAATRAGGPVSLEGGEGRADSGPDPP